ncbi:hypothetical protein BS297_27410 [Rhodococcus erythropolis]|uniref:Uncharacterized protein n=1 Tax=Rhodococcus erythropolis TaxID=1833 RepID=A0A0C2VSU0_RHOER|nr:hypothetical protein BS297_27410 [Rhodococcus erythropolis]KIM17503.1 hypothetical protein QV65_04480 [Rhodococcus erythropolis]
MLRVVAPFPLNFTTEFAIARMSKSALNQFRASEPAEGFWRVAFANPLINLINRKQFRNCKQTQLVQKRQATPFA